MNPETPNPVPPQVLQPMQPPGVAAPGKSRPLIIVLGLVLLISLVGNGWLYAKHSSDQKKAKSAVAAATPAIQKDQAAADQAKYDEQNKLPYKTYQGSATYGAITFKYPNSWGAYIDETSQTQPLEGYFYPGSVPGITSGTAFALRVELLSTDYTQAVATLNSSVSAGTLRATAYIPPKLAGVANVTAGVRFDGQISQDANGNPVNGSLVVLKVRDKTLQISTQSNDYLNDFNNTVLANLSYNP